MIGKKPQWEEGKRGLEYCKENIESRITKFRVGYKRRTAIERISKTVNETKSKGVGKER